MPTETSKIKPYYQDNLITEYHGHTPDVLKEMPPESVHCIVTSIPYWGLRDYQLKPQIWAGDMDCPHKWGDELPRAHKTDGNVGVPPEWQRPSRAAQEYKTSGQFCQLCGAWRGSLGLEPTAELYIQHIVQIWRELKRVLRKDGTCWLNIGDSYASGKGNCFNPGGGENSLGIPRKESGAHPLSRGNISDLKKSGLKPKDLCLIPSRVALALQADGWWLRSDIIWAKPNPMPESVTDRPTNSYEHIFLLTKSAKYFYDQDAVREIYTEPLNRYGGPSKKLTDNLKGKDNPYNSAHRERDMRPNPTGRNLRNIWTIATEPTPEAHFATFPTKLAETCIKAGTSEKGCCSKCGAPWVRIMEKEFIPQQDVSLERGMKGAAGQKSMDKSNSWDGFPRGSTKSKTIGWKPSCECKKADIIIDGHTLEEQIKLGLPAKEGINLNDSPISIPCTVLDPFSGSGKALIVAKKLGRKAIGIDLKQEYLDMPLDKLAQERLF
ncbi:MAG: site-specific DNA-methyltransferase [Candidatus Atribacteria bacterium]|nr:site-specific DNA-methyltransferase [Candidatus Atribacteria bacterium]